MPPIKDVACPRCGTRVAWTPASQFRPFCSERCKVIDLGAWAAESYRIPLAETAPPDAIAGPDAGNDPASGRRGD